MLAKLRDELKTIGDLESTLFERALRPWSSFFDDEMLRVGVKTTTLDDGTYVVSIDAPGVKKQDVDVFVLNRTLRVKTVRRDSADEEKTDRTYVLPHDVDSASADAEITDGVLTLRFKRSGQRCQKKIEVKSA